MVEPDDSSEFEKPEHHGSEVPSAWQRLRLDTVGMMPFTDPTGRLMMGLAIAVVAGMVIFVPTLDRARPWMMVFGLFGVAMIASGCMQILSNNRFRRDMQRAEGEWGELTEDAV